MFTLKNDKMAYVIYLNPNGELETLYMGKPWEGMEADLGNLPYMRGQQVHRLETNLSENLMETYGNRYEISSHGLWDKKGAPIISPK